MCIAILKPYGKTITDEALLTSFENNRDGAGIAYTTKGRIKVVKGIFDAKEFVEEVRKAEAIADGDMLIHCRIGTSGLRDGHNCHPHIVNETTVLIHNGILDVEVPKDSKESDTIIYINRYLKNLPKDFLYNNGLCEMIEAHIGDRNKFILLNNKGKSRVINEKAGYWDNGVWYSNKSYIPYTFNKTNCYSIGNYNKEDDFWYEEEEIDKQSIYDIKYFEEAEDILLSLTKEEIIALGEYPMYVPLTDEVVNSCYGIGKEEGLYLYEIHEELQSLFDELYMEALESEVA